MKKNRSDNNPYICDQCPNIEWVTDKDWNYSIQDHKPLTLICPLDGEHIVRETRACDEIPQWKNRKSKGTKA